jgi:hypothetical protein
LNQCVALGGCIRALPHSVELGRFFPSKSGKPASWCMTAVTSPLSFLMKLNCAPLINAIRAQLDLPDFFENLAGNHGNGR